MRDCYDSLLAAAAATANSAYGISISVFFFGLFFVAIKLSFFLTYLYDLYTFIIHINCILYETTFINFS